jgi:site-specific recombinase XerD
MVTQTPATAQDAYLSWLSSQPVSDNTRRTYRIRVSQFCAFLEAHPLPLSYGDPLQQPNARDFAVRDFKTYLKTEKKVKASSVNLSLSALDHFYRFLRMERPQVLREALNHLAPKALEAEDQKHFLRIVKSQATIRDRALALLLYYTGLRLSESLNLNVEDVCLNPRQGKVIVRAGKGDNYREVPLNSQIREALQEWKDRRATKHPDTALTAFFLTSSGRRLTVRAADLRIRKLAQVANLSFSAHTLRHTCLTNLVRGGNDLVLVAEIAGHKRLETTRRYSLPSHLDREKAMTTLEMEY